MNGPLNKYGQTQGRGPMLYPSEQLNALTHINRTSATNKELSRKLYINYFLSISTANGEKTLLVILMI